MPPNKLPLGKIMVVEDDPKIAQILLDYLQQAGYHACAYANGAEALAALRLENYDLLLLDLMLPGMDGLSLCQAIRPWSRIPIIMLTARVDEVDRLIGLEAGADDYVCKPFSPKEVMARVRALLRRAQGQWQESQAPWHIAWDARRIRWQGQWLELTPIEFRLLAQLINHHGRIFSRAQLLETLHEDFRDTSDRAIDSHIKNIRKKIQAVEPTFGGIQSIYGVGYRFDGMYESIEG